MILFSLFYFVPENENDMLSGFGLFRGGIVHFWRKKVISAQREAGIVHFRREKVISAQREAGIVHFWRKKRISAQSGVRIVHFRRKSGKFAK